MPVNFAKFSALKKFKYVHMCAILSTQQLKMQAVSATLIVIYVAMSNWFLNKIFNSFQDKNAKNIKTLLSGEYWKKKCIILKKDIICLYFLNT